MTILPTPAPRRMPGSPTITNGRILTLALPMMASHATTPLLGFVGATVVGRLGDASLLGAVALGSVVFDFLFLTFGSLRMATAGLSAQATGRGDPVAVDTIVAQAIMAGVVAGTLMVALQGPIGWLAIGLAGATPATSTALAQYFAIRIFAAPFAFANYAILGSAMGRGRTDLGLIIQVAINLANIGMTILFVLGFHGGVAGAAWAALLAEVFGVAVGVAVFRRLGARPFAVTSTRLFDRGDLRRMATVNADVMVRSVALMTAFSVFAALGARAGDATLAANAVLENMFLLGSYMLDGFATAAETLCGQAMGAGDPQGFRRAVRLSLRWCVGFGLVVSGAMLLGGGSFIDTMTTSPAVRDAARQFLPYAALAPLVGAAAFAFDGIFIGATWTRALRNLMLIALAVDLALLAALRPLGNAGLWIALLVFFGIRGAGQAVLLPGLMRRSFALPSRTESADVSGARPAARARPR